MNSLAIIRTSSSVLNLSRYNVQEIGLGKALCERGWNVDLFLRGHFDSVNCCYQVAESKLNVYSLKGIGLPGRQGFYPGLFRKLGGSKYSLMQIHEDSQITSMLCAIWGWRHGIPVVLYQGMYEKYLGIKGFLQACFNAIAGPIYKKTVSYSIAKTGLACEYLQNFGFTPVYILPVGLELEKLNSNTPAVSEALQHFRKRYRKVLIYVGEFTVRRNPCFMIDLLYNLADRWEAGLILIGRGPQRDVALKRADQLGITERILYKAVVEQKEIGAYYRSADLLILPSYYEIYGMVMLEALFFGVPVVASRSAGSVDILREPYLGAIIEDFDIAKWADACSSYLGNSTLHRDSLHSYIVKNFNWNTIASRYIQYYNLLQ